MTSTWSEQYSRIEEGLSKYKSSIEHVAEPYYLWKTLRNSMAMDKDFFDAARQDSQFWIPVLHSLQASKFVALGRVFDKNSNAFNIKRLRKICEKNIDAFSLDAYVKRRNWDKTPTIDEVDYNDVGFPVDLRVGLTRKERNIVIENHYALAHGDIEYIFDSLKFGEDIYKNGAKVVRDDVFAHTRYVSGHASSDVFDKVIIGEFERILDDLLTVYTMLSDSLLNGHAPHKVPLKYKPDKNMKKVVESLADKLKGGRVVR